MLTDWALATLHHLAIFVLAATLAAELAMVTSDVEAGALARLATVDLGYGIMAAIVLIVGVARVVYGAKGQEYYIGNHFFWTKMALFVVVGLLSIPPTLHYRAWYRQWLADATFRPPVAEIARLRAYLWAEAAFFLAIPAAAAAMARGYGA